MLLRTSIFRPLHVLVLSLAGALLYASWTRWRFSGAELTNQYVYVVPIVFVFVAFMVDRLGEIRHPTALTYAIDTLVVGTAAARVVFNLPFVSGHALFLTYAALRPGSKVTRICAGLVMFEVIYLKFFVWHDLVTPVIGIALALLALWIVRHPDNHRRLAAGKSESAI